MAIAEGVTSTGGETGAAEITTEDLDLLAALEVEDVESEETEEEIVEEKPVVVAKEKAAVVAKTTAKGKAAKAATTAEEEEAEEQPKWFDESVTDDELKKVVGQFDSRETFLETLNKLQKALGLESTKDWRESIKDAKLKEHADRFSSPVDIAKAHFDLRQKLSSALIPPGKDASKEEKNAFAVKLSKMLGVPDKPEGYEFPTTDEGVELTDEDKAARAKWANFFHKIHLPKPMADALLSEFNQDSEIGRKELARKDKQFAEATEAELRVEWGDDYKVNHTAAFRAGKELFGDDFEHVMSAELSDGRLLMDTPFMLKVFSKIGREMSEGGMDVLSDSVRETLDEQVREVRERVAKAKDAGDNRLANKLYAEEQALLKKLVGNKPIVGDGDRVV